MFTKSALMISLWLVLSHIPLQADPVVYVISAGITGNGQFGTVDLSTGAYEPVGPIEPDGYFGLASVTNGSLVAGTYAANIDSINPITGVNSRIGATGLGPCVVPSNSCGPNSFGDLGGVNGKVYATDFQNNVYTINPLTGAATLLNSHSGIPAIPFVPGTANPDGTLNFYDEAIWDAAGTLYATFDAQIFDPTSNTVVTTVIAPRLYQIDPLTGAASMVGGTDLGIGGVVDVAGTSYAFNDLTGQISSIDLSSGRTSVVANFDPAAGVIQGAAVVTPEPASAALAFLGLIGLMIWRRRQTTPSIL